MFTFSHLRNFYRTFSFRDIELPVIFTAKVFNTIFKTISDFWKFFKNFGFWDLHRHLFWEGWRGKKWGIIFHINTCSRFCLYLSSSVSAHTWVSSPSLVPVKQRSFQVCFSKLEFVIRSKVVFFGVVLIMAVMTGRKRP